MLVDSVEDENTTDDSMNKNNSLNIKDITHSNQDLGISKILVVFAKNLPNLT